MIAIVIVIGIDSDRDSISNRDVDSATSCDGNNSRK